MRSAFLDQFDPELLPWVAEFASVVSHLDHDVVIFTARKSACLYDAMRRVGLTAVQGVVVSDRVLDMDLGWLAGRRVAVVDDVLITGSSLHRVSELLIAAGVASVDTYALAVDVDNWVPSLVAPATPYLELRSSRAVNLCTQIVNGISVVPRPYNLDWPFYEGLSLPYAQRHFATSAPGWRTFDTTSGIQWRNGILSLSHEAAESTRRRFYRQTGVDPQLVRILKVRTLLSSAGPSPNRAQLKLTAIAAIDGVSVGDIDTLFATLTGSTTVPGREQFTSAESKLRAVQFLLAAQIGRIWMDDLGLNRPARARPATADNEISLVFSPPSTALIRSSLEHAARPPVHLLWKSRDSESRSPTPTSGGLRRGMESADRLTDQTADHHQTALGIQRAMTEPFMRLYQEKELPARELLRELGPAAFADPAYTDLVDRLARGYAFEDLAALAEAAHPGVAGNAMLSAFLDVAVDHGIAVPIVQISEGVVQRAYRHGEDVVFSMNEAKLYSLMLETAFAAHRRAGQAGQSRGSQQVLSRIAVEKLCVLFTRIGLGARVLERWNGALGARNTLGTRWHLHGALMQQNADTIYGSSLGHGLSDYLVDAGVLRYGGRNRGFEFLAPLNVGSTSAQSEALARKVGYLFGSLLQSGPANASLSSSELTLLASCRDLPSLVGALSAEIEIASRSWSAFRVRLRGLSRLISPQFEDVASSLASSDLWTATMSGEWKFSSYNSSAIDEIVIRVTNEIDDPLMREEWRSYWPDAVGSDDTVAPSMSAHADSLGRWLTATGGYLALLRFCLLLSAESGDTARQSGRLLDMAARLAATHRSMVSSARHSLSEAVETASRLRGDDNDLASLVMTVSGKLDKLCSWAPSLLDKTMAIANPFGAPQQVVSLDSALVLFADDASDLNQFEDLIRTHYAARRRATAGREVRLDYVSSLSTPAMQVIASRGSRGYRSLTALAVAIMKAAPARAGLRACLVPDLADHEQIHTADVSVQYFGSGFDALASQVANHPEARPGAGATILQLVRPTVSRNKADEARQLIRSELGERIETEETSPSPIDERKVEVLRINSSNQSSEPASDLGIVTIISEETHAVNQWLKGLDDYTEEVDANRFYYSANLATGAKSLRVVHTQALDQGDTAAVLAHEALSRFARPRLNVLLGIAGGISPEIRLGDVVLGLDIIDYGPTALTADGPVHRGSAFKVPARVRSAIRAYFSESDSSDVITASSRAVALGQESFRLAEGPIGTGPSVVKFRESAVRDWLLSFNEKTLALETEAEGAARHFYEQAESQDIRGFMVIRGISDHADSNKDDNWKRAASANAVVALQRLLPRLAAAFFPTPYVLPPTNNPSEESGHSGTASS